ncbi:hypothetical protein BDY19DRAFT_734874 [Irpex rosettiformis]|uniref:Uncharacterized protein n=1 Tax=Irpex rosettiformis TaxID=378272 RepID=A0ACB8U946_9APHY|nr:hypothetical protein BDY19DRAFT_734874 [Irpex rosettiformis]
MLAIFGNSEAVPIIEPRTNPHFSACTRSWVFHAIYRGSSAAFAIIDLDGKNISDESTPTEPPTGLSFWCTISIFAVLGLCFVHFFVVIAWLTNIATQVTTCSPASVQTSISESSLPHERYVGQELHERDTLPTQNPASGYDSLSQAHIGMHGHRKKGLRRTKSAHTIYENRKQEAKLVEANIGSSAIQKSLSDSRNSLSAHRMHIVFLMRRLSRRPSVSE